MHLLFNRLKTTKFLHFLLTVFIVLCIQRTIMYFIGSAYLFQFSPTLKDLMLGYALDFGWSVLLVSLGSLLDGLFSFIRILPAHLFVWISSVAGILLTYFLDNYYLSSASLLSNMILLFDFDQLLDLLAFDEQISWFRTLWLLVLMLCFIVLQKWLLKRWKPQKWQTIVLVGGAVCSLILLFSRDADDPNVYAENKSHYFVVSLLNYNQELQQSGNVTVNDFKQLDPLFLGKDRIDPLNLLQKKWNETSDFASFFKTTSTNKPPSICIIIVESLSSSLVGKYAESTGNVMPFLDSLSNKSLYFPNTLSSAQRTHHVLPAIFASLPHSIEHTCFQEENYPEHIGIAKMTNESHYSTYYCGLDLGFNQMDRFVRYNDVDYESNTFPNISATEKKDLANYWGYPDHIVFREYVKEQQKRQKEGVYHSKAALDILLTLSTHEPFNYPEKLKHQQFVTTQLKKSSASTFKTYLKSKTAELGAFHYTDESLKKLFSDLKKLPNYSNTIFIITGDHGSTLLYENEMSKYHVPMLIFSPLLKKPKQIPFIYSHLDVAPTLMNYLRTVYHVKVPEQHYFLGKEMNLTRQDERALIFKGENLLVRDVLYKKMAYLSGKLYRIDQHLKPFPIQDNNWLTRLKKQANYMRKFNHWVVEQNKLLPISFKRVVQKESRSIEKKELFNEYLNIIEIDHKKYRGKDMLIDFYFEVDSTITKGLPPLPFWVKVSDSKDPAKNTFEKMMYGRYLKSGKNHPHQATVHFYISKNDIRKMDPKQKMVCFVHNVQKYQLPFKSVTWTIH